MARTPAGLALERLWTQRLTGPRFDRADQAVAWFGAVQAQDYAGAKWALAQRLTAATDPTLDAALLDGTIVRTHLMRPTWHFVMPADVRWIMDLTAPRVHAACAYYYRKSGLDPATFKRSNAALAKAVRSSPKTRPELAAALRRAKIATAGFGFNLLLIHAELSQVLCSGGLRGKQQTYALFDERIPPAPSLPREEALARLAQRYFTSHGPASIEDFTWWSGLTSKDARLGLDSIKSSLARVVVDDRVYWSAELETSLPRRSSLFLLPNYDEYLVAYQDRGAFYDPSRFPATRSADRFLSSHAVVVNGQVVGSWKRTIARREVDIEATIVDPLTPKLTRAFDRAAQRYADFIGLSVKQRVISLRPGARARRPATDRA